MLSKKYCLDIILQNKIVYMHSISFSLILLYVFFFSRISTYPHAASAKRGSKIRSGLVPNHVYGRAPKKLTTNPTPSLSFPFLYLNFRGKIQ